MAKKNLQILASELPQTVVLGPNRNDKKAIVIRHSDFDQPLTIDIYCSYNGTNPFKLLVPDNTGGVPSQFRVALNKTDTDVGFILSDCPFPYIHLAFSSSSDVGEISEIEYDF